MKQLTETMRILAVVAIVASFAGTMPAFALEEHEEKQMYCDQVVAEIHANVERKRREVDKIARQLLDFRSVNKIDNLRASRESIQQGLSKTTGDVLALETEATKLEEWEKVLLAVQKNPSSYASLSINVSRAQEIAAEFHEYQDADKKCRELMISFTDNHPDVIAVKRELEFSRQKFLGAVEHALSVGRSTLKVARNRLSCLRQKQEDLRSELASVEQRIVLAESGLGQLEAEFGVANRVLEGLIEDERKTRQEANIMFEKLKLERMRLEIERLKLERAKLEQLAK